VPKKTSGPIQKTARQQKARSSIVRNLKKEKLGITPDVNTLAHELQVHQIELQMQNEELLRAQHKAEESQARYVNLYDFAPVGYLTFDEKGLISQLNLTAAALLGIERTFLINKPFSSFLEQESQDTFYLHSQEVLQSHDRKTREIVVKRKDGTLFDGQLESAVAEVSGTRVILSMLTDITERKRAEEELLAKSKALEELNTALKVLLDHYKNDQKELDESVASNIRLGVIPYIEKLKRTKLDAGQAVLAEIIERSFRDIASPFLKTISSEYFRFTPKEIEVIHWIKGGKTTKEIAQILSLSKRTIDSYRDNIRSKLGLSNKKVNLNTHLISLTTT
jgi:PAS domain S-box-containing protein